MNDLDDELFTGTSPKKADEFFLTPFCVSAVVVYAGILSLSFEKVLRRSNM